jgi:tetratricopeptide (TPR) repeat protein
MRKWKIAAIGFCLFTLSGCAAFGVPSTNDPHKKLDDARWMMNQGRAIPAERLINEALDMFKANEDKLGTAEAYRMYAFLLRSPLINEHYFRAHGFRDKSVTLENRYAKSVEAFEKSKEIYIESGKYGPLTNIYLNIGSTYELMGDQKRQCTALDESLESNREFLKANPNVKIELPSGFSTYQEYVLSIKARIGC